MHKALHPRDDIDRLSRKGDGSGRGLTSIEDSVDVSIRLKDPIEKREGRLITANKNNTNTMSRRPDFTRKQKWEEKQLYGCFKRLTSDISHNI